MFYCASCLRLVFVYYLVLFRVTEKFSVPNRNVSSVKNQLESDGWLVFVNINFFSASTTTSCSNMFSTSNWPAIDLTFKGEHFENFASVVLRVPGLMLIDQWSHISSDRLWPQTAEVMDKCYAFIFHLSINIYQFIIIKYWWGFQWFFYSVDSWTCNTNCTTTKTGHHLHALFEFGCINWSITFVKTFCFDWVTRFG